MLAEGGWEEAPGGSRPPAQPSRASLPGVPALAGRGGCGRRARAPLLLPFRSSGDLSGLVCPAPPLPSAGYQTFKALCAESAITKLDPSASAQGSPAEQVLASTVRRPRFTQPVSRPTSPQGKQSPLTVPSPEQWGRPAQDPEAGKPRSDGELPLYKTHGCGKFAELCNKMERRDSAFRMAYERTCCNTNLCNV
ncbi:Serum amyloid A protein [Varanus komodoensis]|nr:Serum amyloid A protein [Varanus komodoensis]